MNYTELVPTYLEKFHCIGGICKDICCESNWTVNVDEETYQKYISIDDNESIKSTVREYIVKNDKSKLSEEYAKIKFDSDRKCPFLNKEKMCVLQQCYGADYLSKTCYTYPRVSNRIDGIYEISGQLSCPEIARLALGEKNGIDFTYREKKLERHIVKTETDTRYVEEQTVDLLFWDIRNTTIDLIQNRKYTLRVRLILLAIISEKIDTLIKRNDYSMLKKYVANLSYVISNFSHTSLDVNAKRNDSFRFNFLYFLLRNRFKYSSVTKEFKDYINNLEAFVSGENQDGNIEVDQKYCNAKKKVNLVIEGSFEYIFENYFVNEMFMSLFPNGNGVSVFDALLKIVIKYALIRVLIDGEANINENINEDVLINIIQVFSKNVDHTNDYIVELYNTLKTNHFDTLSFLSVLIDFS